ncbi:uncharacterized protein isoform X2 [Rhodnius prolixus]|uniref:uncharacterized protein isoform X2 n=1 Tax=Rhodnius prolixus TaxID=13249 RepID=UPI003D187BE8
MSQSKFSPSKNGKIPEWLPEDDCKRRKAVVSIYVNATTGVNGPTSTYKHWALVFEFEDGPVRVIEGLEFKGLVFIYLDARQLRRLM